VRSTDFRIGLGATALAVSGTLTAKDEAVAVISPKRDASVALLRTLVERLR
jgi:hypothetical protein